MANSLGVATALAGGGYAAQAGYASPLAASAAMPMLASLIVALTFVEPPRYGSPHAHTLQHQIEGTARATVTSLAKMAQHACEPVFLLYIGAIAQAWSFSAAFAAVAALTFVLAIVFVTIAPARNR